MSLLRPAGLQTLPVFASADLAAFPTSLLALPDGLVFPAESAAVLHDEGVCNSSALPFYLWTICITQCWDILSALKIKSKEENESFPPDYNGRCRGVLTCFLLSHCSHCSQPSQAGSVLQYSHFSHRSSRNGDLPSASLQR